MGMNEQETRYYLIDPILRKKGYDDIKCLKCEPPAFVEPSDPKGRRKKGSGRTPHSRLFFPCYWTPLVHCFTISITFWRFTGFVK